MASAVYTWPNLPMIVHDASVIIVTLAIQAIASTPLARALL
jgi:hypothetical protein